MRLTFSVLIGYVTTGDVLYQLDIMIMTGAGYRTRGHSVSKSKHPSALAKAHKVPLPPPCSHVILLIINDQQSVSVDNNC